MRAALLALALPLAACTQTDAVCAVPSVAASPAAPPGRLGPARTAPAADLPVGRWVAVDVVGDAEASRDLARGTLEKVLVVNPGGHVILRGVDRARSADPVSFTGTLVGRIVRFAELPGAATLVREGTRLVLTDPSGRRTRFVRDAE
jgi:hypothetical protein